MAGRQPESKSSIVRQHGRQENVTRSSASRHEVVPKSSGGHHDTGRHEVVNELNGRSSTNRQFDSYVRVSE